MLSGRRGRPLAWCAAQLAMVKGADSKELGAIFAGGAVGAVLRLWLSVQLPEGHHAFPWLIFGINVGGAFLLAYTVTRLGERVAPTIYLRPAIASGFCGAFTTFSTMEAGLAGLAEAGDVATAVAYAAASLVAGLVAAWIAVGMARRTRMLW